MKNIKRKKGMKRKTARATNEGGETDKGEANKRPLEEEESK